MILRNEVTGKDHDIKPTEVNIAGFGTITAAPKVFSTKSIGLFASGKIHDAEGNSYQVSLNITLIGSKPKAE